ncbi:uncharacterized protein CIMG_13727 [Coccidioides immitis RS]|uniref:Uncharacterized protein n=4 Tax=Coccidioides immitis TaxID=5501 RepID=A0A0D8JWL7_COCIM|nr:uncharacterized protein CIMG_13727 [Coccidioides immitis RS]KMP07853.1 hypothetical protein CIRG_07534 [Coccidioides immitis RMSCC 2394]KMU79782.1 hypothetical protein CISG_08063 [Coccidioides immitis RMSCC 3703]KMU85038.1 hypothetical protein CIHG_02821 [Coccidioides immitis H538.4]TPX19649.1 hypothetical protein DIZ76_017441 [Coccidioides immitis]KJF61534.1 hypothetical protein CIMG_13727 [Coccidioides immitis RS]
MSRTIHLAIFSNGARPAHYAVFIPTGDAGKVGKLIHVTGTTATGFFLEFKRNYDFSLTQRKHQLIPLAQVNAQYITDTVGTGQQSADTTARDRLESVATIVLPPGRSANPFDPSAPNCQNWMRDYIQRLIAEGLVASGAGSVVQSAPRLL